MPLLISFPAVVLGNVVMSRSFRYDLVKFGASWMAPSLADIAAEVAERPPKILDR